MALTEHLIKPAAGEAFADPAWTPYPAPEMLERVANPERLTAVRPFLQAKPSATAYGRIEEHPNGCIISTSEVPWAYAAVFGIEHDLQTESEVLVAVTGRAVFAKIGILFEDRLGPLREVFFEPGRETETQLLTIPRIASGLRLVVRTAEEAVPGRFELGRVEAATGFDGVYRNEVGGSGATPKPYSEHVISDFDTVAEFQHSYLDRSTARVRPCVRIRRPDGSIYFETNEWGFKAGPVDPSRKQVAVWGDSVVWGAGRGWVGLLDDWAPGYQFLNGGMQGIGYTTVLERAVRANQQYRFELNLVMPGALPVLDPLDRVETRLRRDLAAIARPALMTSPTALNAKIRARDLSALLVSPIPRRPAEVEGWSEVGYAHMGGSYSVSRQKQWFDDFVERNELVRRVSLTARLPLVDLAQELETSGSEDFRELFLDAGHPRPSTYPRIARFVFEALRGVLNASTA